MADVCLIAVVHGEAYERYAQQLFDSAREHLQLDARLVMLPGVPGWPAATLYRYHALLNWHCRCDYIFLCDADMRFEAKVGEEILGRLVATQHPGYVGRYNSDLPYERRPESIARLTTRQGDTYYAGGFVGGERESFLRLASQIAKQIDYDDHNNVLAVWHDESHLNHALARNRPTVVLSPAYCHPDDDSGYISTWPERYERKLVALDKSPAERGAR